MADIDAMDLRKMLEDRGFETADVQHMVSTHAGIVLMCDGAILVWPGKPQQFRWDCSMEEIERCLDK